MDYSLSGLVAWGAGSAIAYILATAFAGGVVNSHPTYVSFCRHSLRAVVLLLAVYPVLWARGATVALPIALAAVAFWGAALGLAFYGVGLWYTWEIKRQGSGGDGEATDGAED